MNNETKHRSLSRSARGDGRSIPGEYVIEPYVSSERERSIRWLLMLVGIPLACVLVVILIVTVYLHSSLHDDFMNGRITVFDDPTVLIASFIGACFAFSLILVFVAHLYARLAFNMPEPTLPFRVRNSISVKTSRFSPYRYWITAGDIMDAVGGRIEFLLDGDRNSGFYPAPAGRPIKWVSSENQEERTGRATMTQPNVVILTDEHDRRITPGMVAWYEDNEDDEES